MACVVQQKAITSKKVPLHADVAYWTMLTAFYLKKILLCSIVDVFL